MKKRETSLSDSDISLQLSDASPLSSDSFSEEDEPYAHGRFPDMKDNNNNSNNNKKKKKKKEEYCICRKGYDGNEFMIACDACQGKKLHICAFYFTYSSGKKVLT